MSSSGSEPPSPPIGEPPLAGGTAGEGSVFDSGGGHAASLARARTARQRRHHSRTDQLGAGEAIAAQRERNRADATARPVAARGAAALAPFPPPPVAASDALPGHHPDAAPQQGPPDDSWWPAAARDSAYRDAAGAHPIGVAAMLDWSARRGVTLRQGGAFGGRAEAGDDQFCPPARARFGRGGSGSAVGGAFDDRDDGDGNGDCPTRAAASISNVFDTTAVDCIYFCGPRIQGFERPPRLQGARTFPIPFRPTGDTAFAAEFDNGSRNSIEAEGLYVACNWLQLITNSLADWGERGQSVTPTLGEFADVHSTIRTHIFPIHTLLATLYELLLTWRADPGWAATLHDAILGHTEAHFTNFASRDFAASPLASRPPTWPESTATTSLEAAAVREPAHQRRRVAVLPTVAGMLTTGATAAEVVEDAGPTEITAVVVAAAAEAAAAAKEIQTGPREEDDTGFAVAVAAVLPPHQAAVAAATAPPRKPTRVFVRGRPAGPPLDHPRQGQRGFSSPN